MLSEGFVLEKRSSLWKLNKLFLSCERTELDHFEDIIKYIKGEEDFTQAQVEVLQATVLHPLNTQLSVKEDYQRNFLKQLISQLEACGEEVSDLVYEVYLKKLNGKTETQEYHHRHFRLNEQTFISLRESTSIISNGTTGLSTWVGGLALAEWCLQNSPQITGRHILELGCGLGLTGLAVCASCQPASYTFTDCHLSVLSGLEYNLQLNQHPIQGVTVAARELDWENVESFQLAQPVDLILAADVVFDERLFPGLVKTLRHFLCEKESRAVVACTERNPNTLQVFLSCLVDDSLFFKSNSDAIRGSDVHSYAVKGRNDYQTGSLRTIAHERLPSQAVTKFD